MSFGDATPAPETPDRFGDYDVVSRLGDGGMSTVYKGRHRGTGAVVALKVFAPAVAADPVMRQRFERQFQIMRALDHPNVVRALEYRAAARPFLVVEYIDGTSVGARVERRGAYPEAEALRLIAQVGAALRTAHERGFVHRDVKPNNVLVTLTGTAKLTGFDLVKVIEDDTGLTRTGRGMGTPAYMAPEQFRNARAANARNDVYSLGSTLYTMLTGARPFDHASPLDCWMKKIRNEFPGPKELNPSVSDRVDRAVRRAMSAEPAQRPASVAEFLEELTGGSGAADPGAVWYLVYRDGANRPRMATGPIGAARKALRDGRLGSPARVLASRERSAGFAPLRDVPEFRDLVP